MGGGAAAPTLCYVLVLQLVICCCHCLVNQYPRESKPAILSNSLEVHHDHDLRWFCGIHNPLLLLGTEANSIMRHVLSGALGALVFFSSSTTLGKSFILTAQRANSPRSDASSQHQHGVLHNNLNPFSATGPSRHVLCKDSSTTRRPLLTNKASTMTIAHMSAADYSTQLQGKKLLSTESDPVEGEEGNNNPTAVAPEAPSVFKNESRRGLADDGTGLLFRAPSSQELHQLQMGDWVARKGLVLALVSLGDKEEHGDAKVGSPLGGAVIEAMDGVGGFSVATQVCLLHHTSNKDGVAVSEAVEHALLDEAINQFLNDGSRISQVFFVVTA